MPDAALDRAGWIGRERLAWRTDGFFAGSRDLPEELPVALSFNRTSHAVMMATPADLADFALGFSLNEGLLDHPGELEELEQVPVRDAEGALRGIELRCWIAADRMEALDARRRHIAGPTGCGLCGLDSLDAALQPPRALPVGRVFSPDQVQAAVDALRPAQTLNARTRGVHGAGFWTAEEGMVAVREDVGRHNALDKLAGWLARDGRDPAAGMLVMSSRVSVELVQKAARMGVPFLTAISAPTSLALQTAEQAGLTVVAVARPDGFELHAGPQRVAGADRSRRPASNGLQAPVPVPSGPSA
ncbi:formate dehydrogenase accessory sulfurtransferase FdhD [Rhizosaccharibacter radicis]|uniref:Sulfur carrier protein FdhD n=1 Tax=Rhizosaccharibacter radicis TaxID=2782605 RepID=A0ABT1VWM0_9PROT|nr:formate dehydrogenase accessory sulfurtransferase FdhD [Acetobacteraceae bacterium KSS12]